MEKRNHITSKDVLDGSKTNAPRHAATEARVGELVFVGACMYHWFSWSKATLHGAIGSDGRILALWFETSVCHKGYLNLLFQVIAQYGVALQLYTDPGILLSSSTGPLSFEERSGTDAYDTLENTLRKHNIVHRVVWPPEAKGRMERFWMTLQKHLPAELLRCSVKDLAGANVWLPSYVEKANSRRMMLGDLPPPC